MSTTAAHLERIPARANARLGVARGWIDADNAVAGCLSLVILFWLLSRIPYPVSGSDGGNWLTLSGGFLGISANAAGTVYPPALPLLLAATRQFFAPVESLRI